MNQSRKLLRQLRYADTWILLFAALFLILFGIAEIQKNFSHLTWHSSVGYRTLLLLTICLLFYMGGIVRVHRLHNSPILKYLMVLFFVLYVYLLLSFTLMDEALGRGGNSIYDTAKNMREVYLSLFVNFRPFRSICGVYLRGFVSGSVSARYVLLNLLGNFCAFMPFALFLPLFFPITRRWYVFLPIMLLTVSCIEALQFWFMVGSCDIDDLILNVSGATLSYALLRIPRIKRVTQRLTSIAV